MMRTFTLAIGALASVASTGCIAVKAVAPPAGHVHYLSPEGMHRNDHFSQAVVTHGSTRTVYVGGQNAVDAAGNIVGKGDIAAQAEQVANNIETALKAAGARPEHVIKWNIYIVDGQNPGPAHAAFQKRWPRRDNPPLVTVVYVSGLAHPDFLMEMEAVAVVPLCHDHDDD